MARRQQPPQINLTPIPNQWHRPGHAPESTRRDRAPGVDDGDLYQRPLAGQKETGLDGPTRDGGYQNHIARDVSDREHYISPSHGHSGHTYRSLQSGTVQDQDKPFDALPSGDYDDGHFHRYSMPSDDPYDQIPEPVQQQNPKPIPKEISQPIGEPISKQPADPISVSIPTRISPRRAKKRDSRKLLVAVVVVVAVLAVGFGVGIGVGILIGAKDGPSECPGTGDTELQKEVAASLRLTLTSHVYTSEMADATSARSQLFLQSFCFQVRQLMESNAEVNKYVNCTISSLREGSVIVDFTVVVVPVAAGFTPSSIAAVFVSTRGNLGDGWVFDVSKLFVLSDATGSTRPSQTTTPASSNTTPAPTTTVTEEIINTTTPTVAERCQNGSTAVFPHPTECQLYYNCSNHVLDPRFEQYMEECLHPQLFDVVTMQCQNYSDVDCGQREELVEYCSYRRNSNYGGLYGPPCSVYYPSCKGLSDGRNVRQEREWSPYYAECKDQRLVGTGECPRNQTLNVTEYFSPDLMRCVSIYEIPAEHGGEFLNCTGRADGLYAGDVTDRPDLYFGCDDGQLTFIDLCLSGYIFDSDSSQCQPRR